MNIIINTVTPICFYFFIFLGLIGWILLITKLISLWGIFAFFDIYLKIE